MTPLGIKENLFLLVSSDQVLFLKTQHANSPEAKQKKKKVLDKRTKTSLSIKQSKEKIGMDK